MKKIIITLVSCLVAIAPVFAQNRIVKSYANLRTQSNVNSTVIEVLSRGALSEGNHTYIPTTRVRYYTNSAGQRVQSPTYYPSVPRGATARCVDGTYSFSRNRRGTCSHHGGVAQWL